MGSATPFFKEALVLANYFNALPVSISAPFRATHFGFFVTNDAQAHVMVSKPHCSQSLPFLIGAKKGT